MPREAKKQSKPNPQKKTPNKQRNDTNPATSFSHTISMILQFVFSYFPHKQEAAEKGYQVLSSDEIISGNDTSQQGQRRARHPSKLDENLRNFSATRLRRKLYHHPTKDDSRERESARITNTHRERERARAMSRTERMGEPISRG